MAFQGCKDDYEVNSEENVFQNGIYPGKLKPFEVSLHGAGIENLTRT